MATITVTSAAPDRKLTTVDQVKLELDITDQSEDRYISRLIDQASQAIVSYTGQEFARETVTEKVAGYGSPILIVSRTPVQSISEIRLDDDVVDSSDYEIESAESGLIRRVKSHWINTERTGSAINIYHAPDYAHHHYEVDYDGGYVLPSDAWVDTRDLPEDVERAALETVKALYFDRKRDRRIRSLSIGDFYSATYMASNGSFGIPDTAMQLLSPYVRFY